VRFFTGPDPVADLKNQVVDMALDLTADQAATLRGMANIDVRLPKSHSVNRRIYFLAINNNRKPALSNSDFRIALAHAIHRDELLNKHFRGALGDQVHRALNGPYPAGTWACNPKLADEKKKTVDPWDLDKARTHLRQAWPKLDLNAVRLTLKYPAGDKQLAEAMSELCDQVSKELSKAELKGKQLKVTLEPQERTPEQMHDEVEVTQTYDLAYWWYDFPDETFWLMPLLGPRGKTGGENFLGFHGPLVDKVQKVTNLRYFSEIQKETRSIHEQFLLFEMPFVPLWQLDPLHATRKGRVDPVPFEPHRIFARSEYWRVQGN
jgi:ABC-type transport system substrate-binding protein